MEEAAEVQLVVGLCWIIQITLERKLPYIETNTNFSWKKKIHQTHAKPLWVHGILKPRKCILTHWRCYPVAPVSFFLPLNMSLIKQEVLPRGPPQNWLWNRASSGSSEPQGLTFSLFRMYWPHSKVIPQRRVGRRGIGEGSAQSRCLLRLPTFELPRSSSSRASFWPYFPSKKKNSSCMGGEGEGENFFSAPISISLSFDTISSKGSRWRKAFLHWGEGTKDFSGSCT